MNAPRTNGPNCAEAEPPVGVTYFIRAGEAIKIGFAGSFKRRLHSLQVPHEKPLEVLAVIRADKIKEYETHQKFDHLRIRGEWFQAAPELLQFIAEAKAEYGDAQSHNPIQPVRRVPRPLTLIDRLHALRRRYGFDSPIGHRCSNLAEMLPNHAAATDPDQKAGLAKNIKRMTDELQRLVA